MIKFTPWPKIPRLSNETYTITEKIDGTKIVYAHLTKIYYKVILDK